MEGSIAETATIHVGNLAHGVTEADLRAVFAPLADVVSIRLITDRRGRRKGTAAVRLRADEPDAVVRELRGTQLGGRTMDLWPATAPAPPGGGRRPKRKRH